METCPCGSNLAYADCCAPLIQGHQPAQSAEALMRSRYSAYVKTAIDYIHDTLHPSRRQKLNREEALEWSKKSDWQGLEILKTVAGGPDDETGTVEFIARYAEKGKNMIHHEIAEFSKLDGRWYFVDGSMPKPAQSIRQGPKIGRNDPCICGSGKKYKKCCGT
ncbi:MAG: YchJ family protein [Desulfobacterales bacterium]|jgi:SEC-C motif-containing protein|nr:YchJ family protein [Desulfobacterales bacterium]